MYPSPALLVDSLPWWLAAPLVELGLLVAGMALDETYVNRATVLAGALALAVHALVAGEVGFVVGLYLDAGLVVGAYGLYAYVVDGYVDTWFRVAAFFLYSPLAVFLVILIPDVVFPLSIAVAGYANLQLMAYFAPDEPYYFGPDAPEDVVVLESEVGASVDGETSAKTTNEAADVHDAGETADVPDDATVGMAAGDPTPAGGESTERGILPEFMRRL